MAIFEKAHLVTLYKGEWGKVATSQHVLTSISLDKWALIYPECSRGAANDLKFELKGQAPILGLKIQAPKVVELPDDKTESYLKAG